MSPDELAAQLAPMRIPESFARFEVQDGLAAIALGLIAGLLVAFLYRVLTKVRTDPVATVQSEIASLDQKGREARLAGLAALLARLDRQGPRPDGLYDAIYDPQARFDEQELERAVVDAARLGTRA